MSHKMFAHFALGSALLLGSAFAQTGTTSTQGSQDPQNTQVGDKSARHERRKAMHDKMVKELGLSDQQQSQLKALHEDGRKQMQAIRNDSSLTKEQKKQKFQELRAQQHEKMNAILTPEQQAKMKDFHEKHGGKRGHGRHRHDGQ